MKKEEKAKLRSQELYDAILNLADTHDQRENSHRHAVWGDLQKAYGYAFAVYESQNAQDLLKLKFGKKLSFKTIESCIGVVGKVVFENAKQSRSDYSIVLKQAHKNKVEADQIAKWIEDKNGIGKILEEVRAATKEAKDAKKAEHNPTGDQPEDEASDQPAEIVVTMPTGVKILNGTYAALIEVKDGTATIKRHSGKSEAINKLQTFFSAEDNEKASEAIARRVVQQHKTKAKNTNKQAA